MAEALRWYLVLAVIGAGGLVPALQLFPGPRSRGLLLARPLALAIVAYVAWLLSWSDLASYSVWLVLGVALALLAVSATALWLRRADIEAIRGRWRLIATGEALFLGVFALVALIRAQVPEAIGTEKPMDLMLLNAVRGADALPPPDPWLSNEPLSYYHLGHTAVDAVAQLAGVSTGVAFNLGLAAVAAMLAAAVFGLASDLVGSTSKRRATPWIAGGIAVVATLWLAPLEGATQIASAHGLANDLWVRAGVDGLPGTEETAGLVPTEFWWWWRATRVIPGTITEFPAFSFVLGDLHAHVMVLPLTVAGIALAAQTYEGGEPLTWRRWIAQPGRLVVASIVLAAITMTNAWDVATVGVLWAAAAFVAVLRTGWTPWLAPIVVVRYLAPPVIGALVLAYPFLDGIDSPDASVALVEGASDPARFALFWLPLALLPLLGVMLIRPRLRVAALSLALAAVSIVALAWLVAALSSETREAIAGRGSGWWVLSILALAAVGAIGVIGQAEERRDRALSTVVALALAAVVIVLVTELVRVDEPLPGRINTVFKLWYHAWLLLALAGAGALALAFDRGSFERFEGLRGSAMALAVAAAGIVTFAVLLYAPLASFARAHENQTPGLDAAAYLDGSSPDVAAAAEWVRGNLDAEEHVVLQGLVESYRGGNLISVHSGVPTLLQWPGHELTWRGESASLGERIAAIDRIYLEGATEEMLMLARRYGVTHLYLSEIERRAYGRDLDARFAAWPAVFEAGAVRILQLPTEDGP